MEDPKLEKLLKMLEVADKDTVSPEEFATIIGVILDGVDAFREDMKKRGEILDEDLTLKMDQFKEVCQRQLQNITKVADTKLSEYKKTLTDTLASFKEDVRKEIDQIELTPGEDGDDAEFTEEVKDDIVTKILVELKEKWTPELKRQVKEAVEEAVKNIKPQTTFINQGDSGFGAPFEIPIKAGLNVTVIKDASGAYVISATGGTSTTFADNEVAAGAGTSFTLANTPIAGSQHVYANGQRLTPTVDYTISGADITTSLSWDAGTILVDYRY